MKNLQLYPELEPAAVELEQPLELDSNCTLCPLSRRAGLKSPCLGPAVKFADRTGDTLLIVGEGPGQMEDKLGQPFIGRSGQILWEIVEHFWDGPIVADNATRCFGAPTASDVDACRPYMAQVIKDVRPKRVITLGGWAAYSVLGRSLPILSVRKGYGWLLYANDWKEHRDGETVMHDGSPIPVFTVLHPAAALRNRFMEEWFREDLKWALSTNPSKPPWDGCVRVVSTVDDARAAIADIGKHRISFDCETSGRPFNQDFSLLCVSITPADSKTSYVWDKNALLGEAGQILAGLLSDPFVPKTAQNGKYDMLCVRAGLGVEVKGVVFDTMLARRILDPDAEANLAVLAEQVGMGGHKSEAEGALASAIKRLRKASRGNGPDPLIDSMIPPDVQARIRLGDEPKQWAYGLLEPDLLHRYCARDSVSTSLLTDLLSGKLAEQPALNRVWELAVRPAISAVEQVEAWGIAVDRQQVDNYQSYLGVKITELQRRFEQYKDFNPSSPKDVSRLLFKELGLSPTKFTDKGAESTDKESLQALVSQHPIAADLLEWRRLTKLMGTYAEALIGHIRDDGRVHPTFRIDGARTGRWSCQDPNIQQLPRASDSIEGKMARDCFIAPKGNVLVELDFKALELRVAASISGDPVMREIFVRGEDYHLKTAQLVSQRVWGVSPENVTDAMRTQAKTTNFAALYRASDEKIAALMKIPVEDAARLKQAIFGQFSVLASWMRQTVREAQMTGEVWTWWAGEKFRRRPLWRIVDKDGEARSKAENGAVNSPIQGGASDLCAFSLVECVRWIKDNFVPAKLVGAIHDALLFEVEESAVNEVVSEARRIMTGWPSPGPQSVPFEVEVKMGPSWGSLKKI
jgi:uracil-DNA glycosylase family 4